MARIDRENMKAIALNALFTWALLTGCAGREPPCDPGPGRIEYSWQAEVPSATEPYVDTQTSAGAFGNDINFDLGDDLYSLRGIADSLSDYPGQGVLDWEATLDFYTREILASGERGCELSAAEVRIGNIEVLAFEGNAEVDPTKTAGNEFIIDDDFHRLFELTIVVDVSSDNTCAVRPPSFEFVLRVEVENNDLALRRSDRCPTLH